MRTLHDAREVQPPNGRVCCAIGLFDGVHLGHQQVLRQAVSDAHQLEATPLCVTFSQHPAAVLAAASPDRARLGREYGAIWVWGGGRLQREIAEGDRKCQPMLVWMMLSRITKQGRWPRM